MSVQSQGSTIVLAAMSAALGVGAAALAPLARAADQPLTDSGYAYTVENGKATITAYFGASPDLLVIPSTVGGFPVTTIGNGLQTVFSNGRSGVVLFPDSVTKISNRAVYDYNNTYFFSIPASVTQIEDGATSSIAIARVAGVAGTAAERYAGQVGIGFSSEVVRLEAAAGQGGSMSIAGHYLVPAKLQQPHELRFEIRADSGYRISGVTGRADDAGRA